MTRRHNLQKLELHMLRLFLQQQLVYQKLLLA
jgi:hypothetical protein